MSVRDTRQPLITATPLAPKRRRVSLFTLLLILLLLGGVGWLGQAYVDQLSRARAEAGRLETLETTVAALGSAQHAQEDSGSLTAQGLARLQRQVDGLSASLDAGQRKQWQLAEVDYYVRLAEQHLILTRDVEGARALLDAADRILAATNDNDLLRLRAAITSDRLALVAAAKVDVAGTYLRLNALDQHIAGLPLPMEAGGHRQQGTIAAPGAAAPAAGSGWSGDMQGLLARGMEKFRGLVTVRHYEEPIKSLMGDTERALVTENLRLHLGQAQLALLRGDAAVYQASLKTAQDDFAHYFQLLPAPEYNAIQQELADLARVQVAPAVPDLKASVGALDALSSKLPLHGAADSRP